MKARDFPSYRLRHGIGVWRYQRRCPGTSRRRSRLSRSRVTWYVCRRARSSTARPTRSPKRSSRPDRDHQPEEGGGEQAGQAEDRAHDDDVHEAPRSIRLLIFAVGSRHLGSGGRGGHHRSDAAPLSNRLSIRTRTGLIDCEESPHTRGVVIGGASRGRDGGLSNPNGACPGADLLDGQPGLDEQTTSLRGGVLMRHR